MTSKQDDLILEIYNAVADESRWQRVLERLADEFHAVGCIVFEAEGAGSSRRLSASRISSGYDRDLVAHYLSEFHDQELANQDSMAARLNAADQIEIFGEDLSGDAARAARDPKSIQWLRNLGIYHWAACFLDKDNASRSRFSMQISEDSALLAEERRERTARLLPHVAKALELGRPAIQVARHNQSLLKVMDRLRIGICILDNLGRVVVMNEEFKRQTQDYDVFRVDRNRHLHMQEMTDQAQLAAFTDDLRQHGHFGARPRREAIVTEKKDGRTALCIEIAPLESHEEFGTSPVDGAIVFSLDTMNPLQAVPPALASIYGLTQTEKSIVDLVCEGKSNAIIADHRDRSIETVNAQVKSILSKTQCANRTQLVRLMSGFSSALPIETQ